MYTKIEWQNEEHTLIGALHESGEYRSANKGHVWFDEIMAEIESGEPVSEYKPEDEEEVANG